MAWAQRRSSAIGATRCLDCLETGSARQRGNDRARKRGVVERALSRRGSDPSAMPRHASPRCADRGDGHGREVDDEHAGDRRIHCVKRLNPTFRRGSRASEKIPTEVIACASSRLTMRRPSSVEPAASIRRRPETCSDRSRCTPATRSATTVFRRSTPPASRAARQVFAAVAVERQPAAATRTRLSARPEGLAEVQRSCSTTPTESPR